MTHDQFTAAYIAALFFTEVAQGVTTAEWYEDAESASENGSIPCDLDESDIAPETLGVIVADCLAFQQANAADLAQVYAETAYDATRAGHDFWLTRNGHGAGFWDRSELDIMSADGRGKLGDLLTKAAEAFGETWATFSEGKIFLD